MAEYAYGKSIALPVRVFAGETPVAVDSLVSARLYSEVPSENEKNDHAEALGGFESSVSSFTSENPTDLIYTVTFPAVDDPDQDSGNLYDTWHPVVNVRLEGGEQVVYVYKPIILWRLTAQFSQLDISPDDIYNYESEIEYVLGDTITGEKISVAKDMVFRRIKYLNLKRNRLQEMDLSELVSLKALEYCLRDLATDENFYNEKAESWKKAYDNLWPESALGYDENDDGVAEPEEKAPVFKSVAIIT